MAQPKPKKYLVRCLGPKRVEHTFWSPDPRRVRICRRCRIVIEAGSMSRQARDGGHVVILGEIHFME